MSSNPYKDGIQSQGKETADGLKAINDRITADEALIESNYNNSIQRVNDEAVARQIADGQLQAQINDIIVGTGIVEEREARIAADEVLQDNIDEAVSNIGQDLSAESTARSNADSTLQTNITAETNARSAADTTLQNNINAEASTRSSADSGLQTQINTLGSSSGLIPSFQTNHAYKQSMAINAGGNIYIANADFTSGSSFDYANWTLVGGGKGLKILRYTDRITGGDIVLDNDDSCSLYRALYTFDTADYNTIKKALTADKIRPLIIPVRNTNRFYDPDMILGHLRFYTDSQLDYPDFSDTTNTSLLYSPDFSINSIDGESGYYKNVTLLSWGGINCLGQGWRSVVYPTAMDKKGKMLKITIEYVSTDTDEDYLKLYIYETVSGTGKVLRASEPVYKGSQKRTFYVLSSTNTMDYMVCFHCISSSTSKQCSVTISSLTAEPDDNPMYSPGGTGSYTPVITTASGTMTNYSVSATYTKEFDYIWVRGRLVFSGEAGTWAIPYVSLPPGLSVNTSKISNYQIMGVTTCHDPGNSLRLGGTIAYSGSGIYLGTAGVTGDIYLKDTGLTNTQPFTFSANDEIQFDFRCPIAQWTSPVTLLNSYTEYASNDGSGGTTQNIAYETGAYYGMDGCRFVNVASGFGSGYCTRYKVTFKNPISINDNILIEMTEDAGKTWGPANTNYNVGTIGNRQYNTIYGMGWTPHATDPCSIYVVFGNGGRLASASTYSAGGASWNDLVINTGFRWRVRKSSGQNPGESKPKVYAEYKTTSTQSIPAFTSTTVNYDIKVIDTHSCVTTGSGWKFTAPFSGVFFVSAGITFSAVSSTVGTTDALNIFKNGVYYKEIGGWIFQTTSAVSINMKGSTPIYLNAGEFICISAFVSNVSRVLNSNEYLNWVTISN